MSIQDLFSLKGNIALVTGSTQGLGFEIALGLAAAGAQVIIHGRNQNKIDIAISQLNDAGYKVDSLMFDINDEHARHLAFSELSARYGRLDILVNNAGVRARKSLLELSADEMHTVLQSNLLSTIEISRQAVQLMSARKKGKIITITSLQGHLVRASDFIYPISKHALETMTKVMAAEFGKLGIRCNAIAPGTFATEFNKDLIQKPENIAMMQKRNPLQRWGEPKEIVGPVVFLASEASSYINGQTVLLDGGFSISF